MPWQMQQQQMQMQQQNGIMPVNQGQYGQHGQQPPYMQHPGQMHMQASATHKHGCVLLPRHPVVRISLMSFPPTRFAEQ